MLLGKRKKCGWFNSSLDQCSSVKPVPAGHGSVSSACPGVPWVVRFSTDLSLASRELFSRLTFRIAASRAPAGCRKLEVQSLDYNYSFAAFAFVGKMLLSECCQSDSTEVNPYGETTSIMTLCRWLTFCCLLLFFVAIIILSW